MAWLAYWWGRFLGWLDESETNARDAYRRGFNGRPRKGE